MRIDSVRGAARRSQSDHGLHVTEGYGSAPRNRELPRNKRSRAGTTSIPFPQRQRIQQQFIEHEVLQAQELYAKKVAQSECGNQGVSTRSLMETSRTCNSISSAVP